MGFDVQGYLFFGITDTEEDPIIGTDDDRWLNEHKLDLPEGVELDHAGSNKCRIPFLASTISRQGADTVSKLKPWIMPPNEQIVWLQQAADKLGWAAPGWHLATFYW